MPLNKESKKKKKRKKVDRNHNYFERFIAI